MKTTFFQRLLRGGKPATGSAERRLALAAFGKHPGWDDYLGSGVDTGIGVDTETLGRVKQALHAEGIRGQIDSGAWEKLEPEKRLEGFDHAFLWLRAGHLILGQIWSSADGKRRRYPMMLCIDGEGVAPAFLLAKARPELKRLRAACQTATTAEEVTAECQAAQERLRTLLEGPIETDPEILLPVQARRRFLAHPALGPERLGMLRALHELGTAPGIFTNGGKPAPGGVASSRTCHLRLPLASDLRNEGLSLWAAFLRCAIPDAVPLLLISRSGADWIDVIVGEPASDDFFWLQASLKASPLTTEIPFELSPELKPRLEQLEAQFLAAEPPAAKAPEPATKAVTPTGTLAVKAPAPTPAPVVPPAPAPAVKHAALPSALVAKAPAPAPAPAAKAPAPAPAPAPKAGSPAPPSPTPQVQESAPKRKRTRLLAGGAVVAVIAGCLLWFVRGQVSTQVPLTITADNISRAYGVANPRLTGNLAGLRPGDGITDAYQTTADSRSPTGQYDIAPMLNDPNRKLGHYRVTTNHGRLTITAAPLTVTASNQTRPYGAPNPPPMVSIKGLREGDDIEATSSTQANAGSPAGRYDIVPLLKDSGDRLRNYTVTTNKGTLTVTPALLTITAKNQRRAYRTPNPELTYEVSGLLNGDAIMVTNQTKALMDSPVGSYEIVPELIGPANKLGNYAATIRKGSLTITPAALTVTANNQRRAYGATNPPLTGWLTPNGDQISASYSTKADASSPPGDYDILPRLVDPNGKQSNYSVAITKGTLTLTPAVVASGTGTTPPPSTGKTFTNSVGMEFVWIAGVPGGGAFVGKYEVTQKQFSSVMRKLPEGQLALGDDLPVVNMLLAGARDFCDRLSKSEGRRYAVPSEQEWLAAANLSADQVERAWGVLRDRGALEREVTSLKSPVPQPARVGSRGAQPNGLCDLFGNVREWVVGAGSDGSVREEAAGFAYYSDVGLTTSLLLYPADPQETGFRCILRQ